VERSLPTETQEEEGIAHKVFDNADFGYYKVTIERPKRLKAQFTEERIAELRFDKSLREPMEWAYETFGEKVYTELPNMKKKYRMVRKAGTEPERQTKQSPVPARLTWQKQLELMKRQRVP
jgi:type I restriction enzyme M protein